MAKEETMRAITHLVGRRELVKHFGCEDAVACAARKCALAGAFKLHVVLLRRTTRVSWHQIQDRRHLRRAAHYTHSTEPLAMAWLADGCHVRQRALRERNADLRNVEDAGADARMNQPSLLGRHWIYNSHRHGPLFGRHV